VSNLAGVWSRDRITTWHTSRRDRSEVKRVEIVIHRHDGDGLAAAQHDDLVGRAFSRVEGQLADDVWKPRFCMSATVRTNRENTNPKRQRGSDGIRLADASGWCGHDRIAGKSIPACRLTIPGRKSHGPTRRLEEKHPRTSFWKCWNPPESKTPRVASILGDSLHGTCERSNQLSGQGSAWPLTARA
jgi:hypothetical protein